MSVDHPPEKPELHLIPANATEEELDELARLLWEQAHPEA
jgi:hypothetical protein